MTAQVLDDDTCFPRYERSALEALERSDETTKTNPFTGIQGQGDMTMAALVKKFDVHANQISE